ncbi:probable NADH dehydrogenase [ubiquinone] 1 alpha subcomplex subunit 5, mitochondrial [Amborella trichopoda]|nr:probable NADH dehydrogenase [ubiquinone] 1 alpha subcomplex subunit 5, mitochondrial [Amborella trichopoda]|eukprot:XP_006843342.2 probable NADH dehydrogenase [ubiquinone] 1 alpha subcomplex subunit 5, mitochondrial [Amborella trichopoda]
MFRLGSRIGGPLLAKLKETTGIVGLEVVPNAREVLISLYSRTLKEIQAVPETEGYRKAVETFTNHRLKICREEQDWENIEKRIGCGQVEELIEEAEDELKLISKMIEWDPWGVPEDYKCEIIEDDTPGPKHVPRHRPIPLPDGFRQALEAAASVQPVVNKKEASEKAANGPGQASGFWDGLSIGAIFAPGRALSHVSPGGSRVHILFAMVMTRFDAMSIQ